MLICDDLWVSCIHEWQYNQPTDQPTDRPTNQPPCSSAARRPWCTGSRNPSLSCCLCWSITRHLGSKTNGSEMDQEGCYNDSAEISNYLQSFIQSTMVVKYEKQDLYVQGTFDQSFETDWMDKWYRVNSWAKGVGELRPSTCYPVHLHAVRIQRQGTMHQLICWLFDLFSGQFICTCKICRRPAYQKVVSCLTSRFVFKLAWVMYTAFGGCPQIIHKHEGVPQMTDAHKLGMGGGVLCSLPASHVDV